MQETDRQLIAVFLSLALMVGSGLQVVQASDMAAKMTTATATMDDMPMPGGCSGCSGDDQGMPMACFAVCGSTVVAILPSVPAIAAVVLVSPSTPPIASIAGHHGPPDPYPPRPTILS